MTHVEVPYGTTVQAAELPDGIPVQVVNPECPDFTTPVEDLIRDALDYPIGTQKLEDMVTEKDHVLIIINDQTRPGPNAEMVKALVERLNQAGVPDNQITGLIATGSHRAPTQEELEILVGKEMLKRISVTSHDCHNNNVHIGDTEAGMPIYVDRLAAEASFIITTGLIAPHKAAGFSGGRKSIVPGVAGMETLRIHHSLPIRPYEPALGWYEENPFHLVALQAAKKVNVRFILNAVQDTHKQNVAVVAGDLDLAHQAGVKVCRQHNIVECDKRADLVITSPGGAPRDCNLYQGQKALATGEMFAEKTGKVTMILVACAEDGIGPEMFQKWLIEGKMPDEIIERFRREGFDVEHIERIRCIAAYRCGFVEKWEDARTKSTSAPKVTIISPPQDYTDMDKNEVKADEMDLCCRAISVGALHKAYPMTVAVGTGAAARIPGTIVHDLLGDGQSGDIIRIGHSSGVTEVDMKMQGENVLKGGVTRTARRIMDGWVYVRE